MDKQDLDRALSPITEKVIQISQDVTEVKGDVKEIRKEQSFHATKLAVHSEKICTLEKQPNPLKAVLWFGGIVGVVGAVIGAILAFVK